MKFRTEFTPSKSPLILSPALPVVLVGSCFAQNIAAKMQESLWNVFCGAGTLYNPLSIAKVLQVLLFSSDWKREIEDSLFESEAYVHSWLFDSRFSRTGREELMEHVSNTRRNLLDTLENAQALIVTFGTAWCYSLNGREDYVVANCHKMPQQMFSRRKASVDEISNLWQTLCRRLKESYPRLTVIFTVSPVRHLKDGFEGNSRSKATLLLAVEDICQNIGFMKSNAESTVVTDESEFRSGKSSGNAIYFPAYEIICDDLRDYRFYASDLVHPSEMAVEYIWSIFRGTFLDSSGESMLIAGSKAYKRQHHRPILD